MMLINNSINFFIFKEIIKLLTNDRDILNFLSICKSNYSFKNKVKLKIFPIEFYCKSLNHGTTAYKYQKLIVLPEHWKLYKKHLVSTTTKKGAVDGLCASQLSLLTPVKEALSPSILTRLSSLQVLVLGDYNAPLPIGCIPSSVVNLTLNYLYKKPIDVGAIPSTVTTLTLSYTHPLIAGLIPESVSTLVVKSGNVFGSVFTPGLIPFSVTDLQLGSAGVRFSHPLPPGSIPKRVKRLVLGSNYNYGLAEGVVPESCEILLLGTDFNQPLAAGSLPDSIKILFLGFSYSQNLVRGSLPKALKILRVGHQFKQSLTPDIIPDSLETICVEGEFNPLREYIPKSLKRILITKLTLYQNIFRDPTFNAINLHKIQNHEIEKYIMKEYNPPNQSIKNY